MRRRKVRWYRPELTEGFSHEWSKSTFRVFFFFKTRASLSKISAKKIFKNLRTNSPIFCNALNKEIQITKLFLQHILFPQNRRNLKETTERCLVVPFIDHILENGIISEAREKENTKYYKITLKVKKHIICIIVVKTKSRYLHLSCFLEKHYPNNKKWPVLGFYANSTTRVSGHL